MLEFVLDVVFDIVFELVDTKLPRPLNMIILGIVILLYIGVVGFILYLAYLSFTGGDMLAACLFLGLAVFIFICGILETRKASVKRKK